VCENVIATGKSVWCGEIVIKSLGSGKRHWCQENIIRIWKSSLNRFCREIDIGFVKPSLIRTNFISVLKPSFNRCCGENVVVVGKKPLVSGKGHICREIVISITGVAETLLVSENVILVENSQPHHSFRERVIGVGKFSLNHR
jgi:hypothetical protein